MSTSSKWRVGVLAAGILAGVLVAGSIVLLSLDPERYFRYSREESNQPWRHPTRAVILLSAVALVETVVVTLALARRGPRLAPRAGVALILLLPLAVLLSRWVMHSPEFYLLHLLWLYVLVVTTFAAFVVGVVSAIGRAHQGSRGNAA
ncbi:MAG TPA: hypothetical protein VN493_20995 [Thermoanaerobaculia bacterium]|nr:hypothetical protein [Thermoanaerobaculia bacterium]